MELSSILDEKRVIFGIKSETKEQIIKELAEYLLDDQNIIQKEDFDTLLNDLYERESLSSTGMQDGIAIPHTKSSAVKQTSIVIAIDKNGKDFASMDDEKSTLFFLIVAPDTSNREYLDILSNISKLSFEEEKLEKMINSTDSKEVIKIMSSL